MAGTFFVPLCGHTVKDRSPQWRSFIVDFFSKPIKQQKDIIEKDRYFIDMDRRCGFAVGFVSHHSSKKPTTMTTLLARTPVLPSFNDDDSFGFPSMFLDADLELLRPISRRHSSGMVDCLR
ncbi:MAG: hypothetical protein IPO90_15810 [Flavobacteriales bacterium]|nr:hypothetical protein [Flavobacteriales bacterium]